jgi:hypothetical protein
MTKRKQALSGLLEKVKAGDDDWTGIVRTSETHTDLVWNAYNGDMNAALMLHNAVLPGCSQYSIQTDPTCIKATVCWWPDGLSVGREAHGVGWSEDNPARALLIAILKALIAGEDA